MDVMDFVALDVETSNDNHGSICQIGIASYKGGAVIREWSSLINPEEHFHRGNIRIHGLTAADVAEAPTLPMVEHILRTWLERQIVVCHTLFDRGALNQGFAKYGLPALECRWLDSCHVARKTWKLPRRGSGLAAVCALIGHEFMHHDALEDAKAAGAVILAAEKKTGLSPAAWLRG